jgi:TPR repeat protein
LGNCYYNGWGVEADAAQATIWYNRAYHNGVGVAGRCLTQHELPFLSEDQAYGRSPEEAFARHLALAQQGDADEMNTVANFLLLGQGVERNVGAALGLLGQAARCGAASALVTMANLHAGFLPGMEPTSRDGAEALKLFGMAQEAGIDCTVERVEIYLKGMVGVERDPARAVALLQDAFARSHVIPMYKAGADLWHAMLGVHEAGSKEASDAAVAAGKPFTMSVDDLRKCHYKYALMQDFGCGLPENKRIAEKHYSSSSDRVPLAKARLDELRFMSSVGKPPVEYSSPPPPPSQQAGKGDTRIGFRRGPDGKYEFVTDEVQECRLPEVLAIYRKEAEEGNAEAKFFLGQSYERGTLGLPVDLQRAKALYTESAAEGVWWAEKALERLDAATLPAAAA